MLPRYSAWSLVPLLRCFRNLSTSFRCLSLGCQRSSPVQPRHCLRAEPPWPRVAGLLSACSVAQRIRSVARMVWCGGRLVLWQVVAGLQCRGHWGQGLLVHSFPAATILIWVMRLHLAAATRCQRRTLVHVVIQLVHGISQRHCLGQAQPLPQPTLCETLCNRLCYTACHEPAESLTTCEAARDHGGRGPRGHTRRGIHAR